MAWAIFREAHSKAITEIISSGSDRVTAIVGGAFLDETVSRTLTERFRDDPRTVYAVTRCLEIISEASRRLPDDLKARHPAIAWRDMAGAGNIYRHDYEDVAAQHVWDAVQIDLPPLRVVIERELGGTG